MITRLQRLTTGISLIQDVPTFFFQEIEASAAFGNHLFPGWVNGVFGNTALAFKFEAVYNKFKAIKSRKSRDKVVNAFLHNNQIESLCNNLPTSLLIELKDLPKSIQKEIDNLFLYLYNTAINYHGFEAYVNDTLKKSIDRFIVANDLEVCPFCGLEGFLNIEGQSRIALDHWLCKDLFPMAAVNFDNLFPIGAKCNERPAKGSKNILIDAPLTKNRIIAYYPYLSHSGISVHFSFVNEPNVHTFNNIPDTDWNLAFPPNDATEIDIYNSWITTMNICTRYNDYIRQNILSMWEKRYKRFIEKHPHLNHAQTVPELRHHFAHWKAAFDIKAVAGSILYISFIDYLINHASDKYLFGLCENFKR